jgi:hypothetical protein
MKKSKLQKIENDKQFGYEIYSEIEYPTLTKFDLLEKLIDLLINE